MPSTLTRAIPLTLLFGALFASGCDCSGEITEGRTCATQTDCRAGEACVDGMCQTIDPGTDAGGGGIDGGGPPPERDAGPPDPGPCGNFDPFCEAEGLGIGTERPFDPDGDHAEDVGLDDEGAIVLESQRLNTNFIWIANTNQAQVVKVDTTTYEEVGRYAVGSDPSRTSVNSFGDVFVGNRGGRSLTKISALGGDCPDTNGDGVITTSAGGGDVLPFGDDDCMLWHRDLPDGGIIRAVAAQDVEGLDGVLRSYVWVGGWSGTIWKLDGETGETILEFASPVPPYGFALDGDGNLWIAALTTRFIGRIDTNRCVDAATCTDICEAGAESADCDGSIAARIGIPDAGTYGITVDFNQRVWTGGWSGGRIKRYDPSAEPGSRWGIVSAAAANCNGIGADAVGFVYAACQSDGSIVRVDANTLEHRRIPTGPNRGIGVDADGKIWGIFMRNGPAASVIRPGPGIDENPVEADVGPTLPSPYTYSDMTGLQLRLATNPRGHYRHLFEGCASDDDITTWEELRFSVETPVGTTVSFNVRTAATRAALDEAPWIRVADIPPDASPISVADILSAEGVTPGRYLMLEAVLRADRRSPSEVITPRVLSMEVTHTCPPILS